jgi:dTDP-4-amino-4,6-dideoxygalactose transaminase
MVLQKAKGKLALNGGLPAISLSSPHEIWPPPPTQEELEELIHQRTTDISIKGRTGIIAELEEQFLSFLDNRVRYCITFNSGTSALLAAYFAMGIEEDDEVIGPALTYHAALSPVFFLKGNVVLVDIEPASRCIDPTKIEAAITEKTKVLTVVHQWGHPADMDQILKIAEKYNLKVLEDCSHAHGSRYKGRLCGTFGDIGAFSFQAAKMIYAGEGGVMVTNNQYYHDRATLLGHYRDRSKEEINCPELQSYWVTGFGLKLRMSPLNAVTAKHAIRQFTNRKEGRKKCLTYFIEKLQAIDYLQPPLVSPDVDMGAWYGFKPLYKKENLRGLDINKLVKALQAEGMEVTKASAPVLSTQPLYNLQTDCMFPKRAGKKVNRSEDTSIAVMVESESLSLPTFYNWETDKLLIDQYVNAFQKIQSNIEELLNS